MVASDAAERSEGLSPLARGKRSSGRHAARFRGPIPAGAGETPPASRSTRNCRAYPRWRGGNHGGLRLAGRAWGLSPLARGKPSDKAAVMPACRPIPAGAGETYAGNPNPCSSRAYPRWRGGNTQTEASICQHQGLSPLARGKQQLPLRSRVRQGPIPAGAGETDGAGLGRGMAGAYPRWRGGNGSFSVVVVGARGLSPLARGKLREWIDAFSREGPIPAGAGETAS